MFLKVRPELNNLQFQSLTLVDTINFILTQISLGFLALTLIIYLLLSGHQNVHSWTQFSYFFALWSNLFIASIIYFQTYEDQNLVVAKEGAGQPRGAVCFTACKLNRIRKPNFLVLLVERRKLTFFTQLFSCDEHFLPQCNPYNNGRLSH